MAQPDGPDSNDPEPGHWREPDWEAQREEWRRLHDAYEANALAHYIRAGNPYVQAMRSFNAVKWIEADQYVLFVRIDAANEFWRIHQELQLQRERRA